MKKIILLILINVSLLSCNRNLVFSEFQSLPMRGWEADSVLVYAPQIVDTTSKYELQIIIRHTDKYPYQNLWLFVDVKKDSTILRRDTIESFLADDRGQWLGYGMRLYELPILYLDKLNLTQGDDYEVVKPGSPSAVALAAVINGITAVDAAPSSGVNVVIYSVPSSLNLPLKV